MNTKFKVGDYVKHIVSLYGGEYETENYTAIINAGLLDNAEIIAHIDFSPIEKRI